MEGKGREEGKGEKEEASLAPPPPHPLRLHHCTTKTMVKLM